MKILKEDIKTGNLKKCYLLYGTEAYLRKNYEQKIKSAIVNDDNELMNFTLFSEKKTTAEEIISYSETLPFLSDKRIILVKDSGLFAEGRKDESEKLYAYIEKIPDTTCVVFSEEKIDKRGRLYKAVAKFGYAVEFKPLTDKEIMDTINRKFKAEKIKISPAMCAYLLRNTGGDIEKIRQETEKLITYKIDKSEITKEDIDNVCVKVFETKIFDLVNSMAKKNISTALEIYRNLLMMKESPLMVLSMITRQFRIMLQCKSLLNNNAGVSDISTKLGIKEFIVREALNQGKAYDMKALEAAMINCLDADVKIKTGKLQPELAVELIIISGGSLE